MIKSALLFSVLLFLCSLAGYTQNVEELIQQGIQKSQTENYAEAIVDFTKAIQIDPKCARAYANRGSQKLFIKDYQGSIIDLNQAIKLGRENNNIYACRGLCKYNLGDYYGAISDFTKALEFDPTDQYSSKRRESARLKLNEKLSNDPRSEETVQTTTQYQKINYPSIERQNDNEVKILSVLKNTLNTVIQFEYTREESEGIYILLSPPNSDNAYYIQANGSKFKLLKTEGIANKDGITKALYDRPVKFTATFEPLPKSITKFDLIEGKTGSWHFYGIDLSKQNKFSDKSKTVANERKKAEPISRNKRETTTPDLSVPYLMYVISPADFTDVNGTNLITLPVGTPLEVLNEENDYYKVRNNGYIGYVNRFLLGDTKKQPDRYVTPEQLTNSATKTQIEEVKVLYPSQNPKNEEEKTMDGWLNRVCL